MTSVLNRSRMTLDPPKESDLFHKLVHAIRNVALIATDGRLGIVYANPYAQELFALPPDPAGCIFPPSVQERLNVELEVNSFEFALQHAVGETVHTLHVTVNPLAEDQQLARGYVFHMHDVTNSMATELELRRTVSLLRALIYAIPDLICFKDDQGRWLQANCSGRELLQRPITLSNEVIKLVEEAAPAAQAYFHHLPVADEHIWKAGELVREEETLRVPEGSDKVLEVIKVPLYGEEGNCQGLVTLGRDITSRKQAERALQQRNALLDALIACDWLLHSSDSWYKVGEEVLELLGLAAQFSRASLFRNDSKHHSETLVAVREASWTASSLATRSYDQSIHYLKDGCARWVNILQQGDAVTGTVENLPADERQLLMQRGAQAIVAIPVFAGASWWGMILLERIESKQDESGQAVSSQELGALMAIGRSFGVAIQRDSAGKRLHQAKIAFESASEGIMIIDENTQIIAINKGFTEITGFSEQEVLGTVPPVLEAERQKPEPHREIWKALLRDGRWRGEFWSQRKNGERYVEWLTLTAVRNDEGDVINYVGVFADITEIKQSQNRLNELVNRDPLTGLPNRRLMHELLDHAIKRAEREQNQIALLFVDLDRFKAINDTLGHQVGDKLLFEVSRRIGEALRDSDPLARLGGDEFIVMMDLLRDREDAAIVAKKIIRGLQNEFVIDGRELFIGASVGISVYPDDSSDVEGLIKAADIAMYQVKNKGKNSYCFYSAELSQSAVERFTMENQLRRALGRDQFEVYYQPQVSLETGRIIGVESLIRWNHPEQGIIPPSKFIPLAEETGLIISIGEWVLRESALQARRWQLDGYGLQWVSVNVSGVQVQRSNFADTVYGILVETDCNPRLLELEITESTVMHNTEYVINVFDRIKQMGVRLAIDDFGTGYSSLSHLKRLPLDKIKIDQSFVRDLPHNSDDAAISNAISAMARSLGFTVIAEGVETQQQAEFLSNIGCIQAQGFLYSKPVTAREFTAMLHAERSRNLHESGT